MSRLPVYFFAFYHHHHCATDDWAPSLSYNDAKNRWIWYHAGTRRVITAHWVNYSHLLFLLPDGHLIPRPVSVVSCVLVALAVHHSRYFVTFVCGYELGVLLLPLAHGWQHIPRSRFGSVLNFALGVILLLLRYELLVC